MGESKSLEEDKRKQEELKRLEDEKKKKETEDANIEAEKSKKQAEANEAKIKADKDAKNKAEEAKIKNAELKSKQEEVKIKAAAEPSVTENGILNGSINSDSDLTMEMMRARNDGFNSKLNEVERKCNELRYGAQLELMFTFGDKKARCRLCAQELQ